MGFHLAANPVEIAVNCGIAAPGVKPDGLPFGLIFNSCQSLACVAKENSDNNPSNHPQWRIISP
ncbi:hypothetical protein ECEPECA12_2101 [Escherichia coli EPECa12]|nr:hypothetical protein ECEPECA12_2101 [Escherichia coli EPECa12]